MCRVSLIFVGLYGRGCCCGQDYTATVLCAAGMSDPLAFSAAQPFGEMSELLLLDLRVGVASACSAALGGADDSDLAPFRASN